MPPCSDTSLGERGRTVPSLRSGVCAHGTVLFPWNLYGLDFNRVLFLEPNIWKLLSYKKNYYCKPDYSYSWCSWKMRVQVTRSSQIHARKSSLICFPFPLPSRAGRDTSSTVNAVTSKHGCHHKYSAAKRKSSVD